MDSARTLRKLLCILQLLVFFGIVESTQYGASLGCPAEWHDKSIVTITYDLDKFNFTAVCYGGTSDRTPEFMHSADGNAYISLCRDTDDITASPCDYPPNTLGCGCVGQNDTAYHLQYTFIVTPGSSGYYQATVQCFDAVAANPIVLIVADTCKNVTVLPEITTTASPSTTTTNSPRGTATTTVSQSSVTGTTAINITSTVAPTPTSTPSRLASINTVPQTGFWCLVVFIFTFIHRL